MEGTIRISESVTKFDRAAMLAGTIRLSESVTKWGQSAVVAGPECVQEVRRD